MKHLAFVLVAFSLVFGAAVSFVSAQPTDAKTLLDAAFMANGQVNPEVHNEVTFASQQFQELPDPVKAIFGNQRVEIVLTRNDGVVEHLGVILANNSIHSLTRFAPQNTTMRVTTDEATALFILQSENKSDAFIQAVNSGRLTYEGINGGGGWTVFITNILVWVATVINSFLHFFGLN